MDPNTLEFQALITFLVPFVIQLAKNSQSKALGWIGQNRPRICIFTSALAALATSLEIQVVHAPHSLTISWPDGATLARGVATFIVMAATQFGGQHVFYESLWRHVLPGGTALGSSAPAVVAALTSQTLASGAPAGLAMPPQGGPQ